MRKLMFFTLAVLFVWACTTQRSAIKIKENKDESELVSDSLIYQLETFDAKFDTWYALHDRPSQYRSQQYYENWNRQYVSAWNYNATRAGKNNFFEHIVGYEPHIDYGFELNHKLFYYFQYVEKVLKIEIMPGGPKSIVL